VILHWLGEMFDPALAGYWGPEPDESVLALIHAHATKIDGIKVSLLDADREVALRAALPAGVKLYTGDDFNYPSLIESGSHALLGIFDAIAVPAARALSALDNGDTASFRAILDPTIPLARHIFEAPTYNYKTGIVFLAWLNGHQEHFRMIGGLETARGHAHLARLYELALDAGVIADPDLAAARWAAM
jgi:dihydrodipicolinate synthase/N-acetylneuraminate lyase